MKPDFTKKTIDILGKRAGFKCSNPDCRVNTVGPQSESDKSVTIGEAAHIYGARGKSARYLKSMTDASRAEITNGIWLCRNCHKLIDSDEREYPSSLLFIWREKHERYIASNLGSNTDKIKNDQRKIVLKEFEEYSPVIKRLVVDKPDYWRYRLTTELLRDLNVNNFRKLDDLKKGLYVIPLTHVSREQAPEWVEGRASEIIPIIRPFVKLIDELNQVWNESNEIGLEFEILHVCKLLSELLGQVVLYEEMLYFSKLPDEYEKVINMLKDLVSSRVGFMRKMPDLLDEFVNASLDMSEKELKENPRIVKTVNIDFPQNWPEKFYKAYNRAVKGKEPEEEKDYTVTVCVILFFVLLIIIL